MLSAQFFTLCHQNHNAHSAQSADIHITYTKCSNEYITYYYNTLTLYWFAIFKVGISMVKKSLSSPQKLDNSHHKNLLDLSTLLLIKIKHIQVVLILKHWKAADVYFLVLLGLVG